MNYLPKMQLPFLISGEGPVHIAVEKPDDYASWRKHARRLLIEGVRPGRDVWSVTGVDQGNVLCSDDALTEMKGHVPAKEDGYAVRVSRAFTEVAPRAILHRDSERFALLYRILWRLQNEPQLMRVATDPDVRRLAILARNVGRDIHKMRAFLRFSPVKDADGAERYVGWFEPDHHIVRVNASFFINRFASQRWSVLTPDLSVHWDGEVLTEGPGGRSVIEGNDDDMQAMWHCYYGAIFNPARLKISAMTKEMPRKYWKNMPETRLIPELIAGAQAREAAMLAAGSNRFDEDYPETLEHLAESLMTCKCCAIGCNGTKAVTGEGPAHADLMIVGEQPGDMEERMGRPFIGPAGQLLDDALTAVGIERSAVRVTNAVRHFKFEMKGAHRLHKTPTAGEIDTCRWWLAAEQRLIRPRIILAMGSSAGRALLGRTPAIQKERGRPIPLDDGSMLWLTVHPSYLLRLKNDDARAREEALFESDLQRVADYLNGLSTERIIAQPPR